MFATNATPLPDASQLLTTAEAARYLRLSVATLERFRVTGEGPFYVKLGTAKRARVVYQRTDLDAWLTSNRRDSTYEENGQ